VGEGSEAARARVAPVSPAPVAADAGGGPVVHRAAQARIIAAALGLFARHGVGGTSLGMIADEIGVTKAAVYHQFKTKDEIVLAAAEAELARLRAVVDEAEAQPTRKRARDTLITGIVALAVESRHSMGVVLRDPVIVGFFTDHKEFQHTMDRMCRLLVGDATTHEARVSAAMLIAAISGAVMHPFVAGLDDATLRAQLEQLARRFLRLPG
jgi:AcrR family transcriptional regulator